MNDAQLTQLLKAAADSEPSETLVRRIRTQSQPHRRYGRWIFSTAAIATCGILFLALPRTTSARAMLEAAQSSLGHSYQVRTLRMENGRWKPFLTYTQSGTWIRTEEAGSELRLITPKGSFWCPYPSAPTVWQPSDHRRTTHSLQIQDVLNQSKILNGSVEVSYGAKRQQNNRRLQDIVLSYSDRGEREIISVDVETRCLVAQQTEERRSGQWIPTMQSQFSMPGPELGSSAFWQGINPNDAINLLEFSTQIKKRFSHPIASKKLSDGQKIEFYDFCRASTGDQFLIYTGPERFGARMEGYARVGATLNRDLHMVGEPPVLILNGKPAHVLWFTPLRSDQKSETSLLHITGATAPVEWAIQTSQKQPSHGTPAKSSSPDAPPTASNGKGSVTLRPRTESLNTPDWIFAMPGSGIVRNLHGLRADARAIAANDVWLDPSGRQIRGTYADQPMAGELFGQPPRPDLRRDPKAVKRAMSYLDPRTVPEEEWVRLKHEADLSSSNQALPDAAGSQP